MELELLKEEFKEKYADSNPVLTDLTMWCLNHRYEDRPDFIQLELEMEKADYSQKPFISEIIPVNSIKKINLKSEIKEKNDQEFIDSLDFYRFKTYSYKST
jgi:predicted metal-dependent RNase